jgi:hypothetical protein
LKGLLKNQKVVTPKGLGLDIRLFLQESTERAYPKSKISRNVASVKQKISCENYLFEDYRWESGIKTQILTLRTSGSNIAECGHYLPNLA